MSQNASFLRKIIYGCTIVVLLFPLFLLGQPATSTSVEGGTDVQRGATGGLLARMRGSYGLSQAELGKIDPASETMKMATLGLRGVATNLLWTKANGYKRTESWDRLSATLNQIARLQPNYITVWEFQAHNLSYNVSSEFDDYRMRYHWVKKGIEFLTEGTRYNQRNPRLFWNIGWFSGHKFGMSDEKVQFRRMFRTDTDFHDTMVDYVNMNNAICPVSGYPDNWLVAYLWYLESQAVVDKGVPVTWMRLDINDEGYSDKRRSAVVFYNDPSMARISYAEATTNENLPGEKTQDAWRRAGLVLDEFGSMDIPTSFGHTVRLNNLKQTEAEEQRNRGLLEEMAPGLREKIREERQANLTPEELAAYNTKKSAQQLSRDEMEAYTRAFKKLTVTDLDVADALPEPDRTKARHYAVRAGEAAVMAERIAAYAMIVNYEYWTTRCKVEQSKVTADARRYMMLADRASEAGDPEGARGLYEQAWNEWDQIFKEYPELISDTMADDLKDVIFRYKLVLDQLDEEFPDDFKLQALIEDENASERPPQPPAGGPPADAESPGDSGGAASDPEGEAP